MPVTAKLSRKFYETLGDDVANELVNWFNEVDATYRSDLRELNELNHARFRGELREAIGDLRRQMESGFSRLEARLEQCATKAELSAEIGGVRAELIKWMFVFWVGNVVTTIGLVLTAVRLAN